MASNFIIFIYYVRILLNIYLYIKFTCINLELFQFKKSSKDHNEQSRTLTDQTDYHRNHLDSPRIPAWSPCSNDSAYFELPITQEPVSLLTPMTPIYTPITSPGSSFCHCTALEQLADIAIEKAR